MSRSAPLLFLSYLIGTTTLITNTKADECNLDCPIDAPCVLQAPDFSGHSGAIPLTPNGGINMHCACPPGWTGVLCDHKFETCNEDHECYHGGRCIPGLEDHYGNDQHFCDCTGAIASDGTHYVGKYCETPFDQICSTGQGEEEDKELFCVNGGECNPNYRFDGVPCTCPDGWEGFHCEFKRGTVPDCTLDCGDRGTCVVGVRDPAEADQFHHVWTNTDISEHMRCLCPDGFGGPHCEATTEECGDGSCYNGGACITTTITRGGARTTEYHCDCTLAADSDGNLFSGEFCQYPSTEICSDTDENLFCVNGGSCNEDDPTKGCDCPDGFDGFKCEVVTQNTGNANRPGQNNGSGDRSSVVECGEVYCFNGGRCTQETFELENGDRGTREICDCSDATDGEGGVFMGSSCQYKANDVCASQMDVRFCVNGGVCPIVPHDGCDCPDGWTGDSCEIQTVAEKDPQTPTCGGIVCLNGGECVETEVIKQDGTVESQFNCDCSMAFDDKRLYAGESCQYPSTHLCTHPPTGETLEGHLFCTNHGTCRDNVLRGCDCPDGFTGFSCEYEVVDQHPDSVENEIVGPEDVERCGDLICHNGGTCQSTLINTPNGGSRTVQHCDCSTAVTDTSVFDGPECQYEATTFCTVPPEGEGLGAALFCVNHGECRDNPMRGCDCPNGWTGFNCEFPEDSEDLLSEDEDLVDVEICGDDFCYNGGKCGVVSGVSVCDCSTAVNDEHLFAGPNCQYPSTTLCADTSEGDSLVGQPFCVNHGQCGEDPLAGCNCPPGWTGLNCELAVEDDQHSEHGEECGDGYCYNGGNCVTTRIQRPDGTVTESFHCDCSNAITSTDLYAGQSCEHKSTSFCSHPQQQGSLAGTIFCVNGGTCSENPLQGCDCPPEWTGFNCEFETAPEEIAESLDDNSADDVQDCGEAGVCLNGGECVTTTIVSGDGERSTTQHCDCTKAYNENDLFAGLQCEFKSTSKCTNPSPGEDLEGTLFCTNGGTCKENVNQGCDCPPTWTGMRCEFQVEEEDIFSEDDTTYVEDFVPCGKDFCYHGGTCRTEMINGIEMQTCDCSTAVTATDLYAGEFCQYRSTQFCSEPTGNNLVGVSFCTNEGQCVDDGCHCPTGYGGSRCEYPRYANQDSEDNIAPDDEEHHTVDDDDDFEYVCHLQCQNGGTCAKGAKDLGDLQQTVEHVSHLNQTYSSDFFEHCVCADGWVGLECEHKAEVCGENEHVCLHGSTCVKNNQEHGCDCATADETLGEADQPLFAGDSCQHPATDICMSTEDYPGRPMYFCVNQGTCKRYVTPDDEFPGCDCPVGWTGPHCEVHVQSLAGNSVRVAKTNAMIFLYVLMSTVGLACVLVASSYCIRRDSFGGPRSGCMNFRRLSSSRRMFVDPKEQRMNNLAPKRHDVADPPSVFDSRSDPITAGLTLPPDDEPEPYYDEPPMEPYRDDPVVVNIGPPRDEDGHELHNVEFDGEPNDADYI